MNKQCSLAAVLVLALAAVGLAGIRSAGKYSGVVIFDRWGGCTLYSGVYVMYVSEGVKDKLRPEAGKCVQLDATRVEQPGNPGDGLIKQFTLIGPAPAAKEWESPEGMRLTAARAFEDGEGPRFTLRVENVSDRPRTLHFDSLAPTLLAAKSNADTGGPSDGPSVAVVTRNAFLVGDQLRTKGGNDTWQWTLVRPAASPKEMTLPPGAAFEATLAFRLPRGEYEFLAGYGGGVHDGQCIASNLVAFDVRDDGKAAGATGDRK